MFPEGHFPPFTHTWLVLLLFVVALLLFHAVLVAWLRLGSLAWKIVDYVWLSLGLIGLIGATAQARHAIANGSVSIMRERALTAYLPAKSLVRIYANEGAVCRKFVRSDFSPPPNQFDQIQLDFDAVCRWFKGIDSTLPEHVESDIREISLDSLPPEPQVSEGDLRDILRGFHQQLGYYNLAVKQYTDVDTATRPSELEFALTMMSPLFLCVALALRITKVTGEIMLK